MRQVSAIVPAAGLARRFGGENKLLHSLGNGTVVGAVTHCLLGCGLPVTVVTGRDADQVSMAVEPAISVFNPRYEEGLGSSIAAGVARSTPADGYLIALGDMPGLRQEVVKLLLREFEAAPEDAIVAPVYSDEPARPGHPVIFSSVYRSQLEELTGDDGAKGIVQRNREKLRLVPVKGKLGDIDNPSDLDTV